MVVTPSTGDGSPAIRLRNTMPLRASNRASRSCAQPRSRPKSTEPKASCAICGTAPRAAVGQSRGSTRSPCCGRPLTSRFPSQRRQVSVEPAAWWQRQQQGCGAALAARCTAGGLGGGRAQAGSAQRQSRRMNGSRPCIAGSMERGDATLPFARSPYVCQLKSTSIRTERR